MKKLLVALLMCCSTVAYGQTTVQPTTTETTHQMGDDGAIKVTLPFTFTYYNQQFTDTWMYDNGIISFLQPGSPNSLSSWQWNAQPLNQTNANYFIASLWADIAPVGVTKYITATDGTYMKYTWQDIAEYYSAWGNWRLNTFSTTLKNDGTIETHYTKINLQTSSIAAGTVGDRNAGEYNQIYYSPCCVSTTTGMIPDWTIAGVPLPPPPPPTVPVVQPEIYVAPVIIEEPITQAAITTITVSEPETTIVSTQPAATIVATTLVQAATESSPASVATASIAATVSASSDNSSNKMSIADAQSIAKTNQKNAAQLVSSVVSNSIESSAVQVVTMDNETSSSSDMVMSTTNSSSSSSSLASLATQSTNNVIDSGNNNVSSAIVSTGLANFTRLPGAVIMDENNETSEKNMITSNDIVDANTQESKIASSNTEILANITDEANPTSVRSLAANNVPSKQVEDDKESKNIEIADLAKDTSVSELAMDGIQLTELQVLPIGYNIYLAATLKDASFYAPKAIYRNQTVVDNAPAQRLLKFASDAKFDQMVSQQYGEQK